MNLSIVPYTQIDDEKWDNFIKSNSMGWAYFLKDVIKYFDNKNCVNMSFAIVDENCQIYLAMQLYVYVFSPKKKHWWKRKKKTTHFLSRWGYVLADNLDKKKFRAVKECFTQYFDDLLNKNKKAILSLYLPPLSEANKPGNCSLINPLIKMNCMPAVYYTCIVDLSKPDERLLADCEETTRQAIRKFAKSDEYEFVESKGSREDCDAYIKLHKETYIRTDHQESIIFDEYHENIFFKLIPQKICRAFFIKHKKTGEYIAGVIILVYKDTAYYWWGCSKNDKAVGINKFLLFKAIETLKKDFGNKGFFETGAAYPYIRSGKLKGLSDFKKCFGTFLHPIWKGTFIKEVKND